MSTLDINYMTKTYNHFLQNYEKKSNETQPTPFVKETEDKIAACAQIKEAEKLKTSSDMTMEEYKAYILNEISNLPMHPSQLSTSYSINITEAGFEAMKSDPEYEKWVLDGVKANFNANDPWSDMCGGSYSIMNFGASKEEYSGSGWYKGYNNGNGEKLFKEKSKGSTWVKRAEQKKQLEEQFEKELLEKRMQQKEILNDYIQSVEQNQDWIREVTKKKITASTSINTAAFGAYERQTIVR